MATINDENQEKVRYSDEELQEFKELILGKLAKEVLKIPC